jgi:hypothetical protein
MEVAGSFEQADLAVMIQTCIRDSTWTLVILIEGFYGFPQFLQPNAEIVPQSGHDHFLPNTFQFIIHQSSYCTA